jgi:hypothetical protein
MTVAAFHAAGQHCPYTLTRIARQHTARAHTLIVGMGMHCHQRPPVQSSSSLLMLPTVGDALAEFASGHYKHWQWFGSPAQGSLGRVSLVTQRLEVRHQHGVSLVKVLRNDAHLTDHGHIVGIAVPAWYHMHVEMLGDTGSGG